MASKTMNVFNRIVKELQRDRAARHPLVHQYEQLRDEVRVGVFAVFGAHAARQVAWQVCDRMHDIARCIGETGCED